ncbi:scavenger receptor class B member 1-like isoform X2 [Acipenser ruthenus]|uniref:scavenger receptor class B member 1-like isoform X2 n=1 Tax=Acipenser ruthenus TaxID=7906 RepID=UPI0027415320|nr:scavenger receptor class B member 1-like isoform X2 [Acipenser ruthenus]
MSISRSKLAAGLGVAGLMTAVFGTVLVFVVPLIVDQQIVKNVQINPHSGMPYTMWKDVPVPFFMSVYFFEVLNSNEILQGEKPVVRQRGPYVYREFRQKDNITFHDNNTVSYREYRQYHFFRNMSIGDETDIVVIPNMLVLGAAVMMEDLPYAMKLVLSAAFKTFNEKPFLRRSVGELMWGYEDPLVDFLNNFFPGMIPFKGKFGLFADFNNSNTGLFTVHTGVDNIRKVHMVDSWNGLKKVNYWNSEQCNKINGTAGQMWPPFMTPETTLPFYSPDACRSMELVYERSGEMLGIPTYHFVAPKTMFANGSVYPPNEGFCPCRESGIQNVSSCRFNSPVFISHPHFYNADPVLLQTVDGLHPNEEEHGLFIDIHPKTGIPMNCSIRLQLSLYIKQVSGISETGRISPVVMPMIWFAESGYIDGPILDTFYNNLVLLPSVLDYMQYVFIALGGLMLVAAVFLGICNKDKPYNSHINSTGANELKQVKSKKTSVKKEHRKVIQEAHL